MVSKSIPSHRTLSGVSLVTLGSPLKVRGNFSTGINNEKFTVNQSFTGLISNTLLQAPDMPIRNLEKSTILKESEAEELKRLRRENKILKQERDILKKATAYFAKETL